MALDATGNLAECIPLMPSEFAWLKSLSKAFDRVIFHSMEIEYRPYSSAMNSGSVTIGVDWNYSVTTPTKDSALACTPSTYTPVYVAKKMILPSSQLMSRKSYILTSSSKVEKAERSPAQLLVVASSDKASLIAGDLFVKYSVTLQGTSA